jgi:endoglucanase
MKFLSSLAVLGGVGTVLAGTQLFGMNLSGFEFGCAITGDCPQTSIVIPPVKSLGGADGAGQMQHFVKDDGMNIFRLPVSWQYLTNSTIGPLSPKALANYDLLMTACLNTGAYCMIDIHNFARWDGGIIGQGGPTDAQFVDLWTQLTTKYADNPFVIFELMNEPHDLDITLWADTCQKVVNAIRAAETASHIIMLPGLNFSSAGTLISSGWGAAMAGITNPDKSTTNLLLDLHKYLDIDNSGDHTTCVMDNVADTFDPVAAWLRKNKRQAMLTETGAGASSSCFIDFCAQNGAINANADVYLAYIAWAAGSVDSTYILDLAPTLKGKVWTDMQMTTECVIEPWKNSTAVAAPAWGLVLPAGTAVTSTSSSTTMKSTATNNAAATTAGNNAGSASTSTSSFVSGATRTIVPATPINPKNSASGLEVAGLQVMCVLMAAFAAVTFML